MTRTSLIRFGGLVTMVGGALFVTVEVSVPVLVERFGLDVKDESYLAPIIAVVLLGAMVAVASIAALYVPERAPERWAVSVTALVSFVGLGMLLHYSLAASPVLAFPVPEGLVFLGAVLATLGLVALGILVTRDGRVLPWWCGAALIAGSPLFAFLGPLWGAVVPGGAWALVGYAVFRAAGQRAGRSSRMR